MNDKIKIEHTGVKFPTLHEALLRNFHHEIALIQHDYVTITTRLQRQLDNLDRVGTIEGIRSNPTMAVDVAADILHDITRFTPNLSSLIRRAYELDKQMLINDKAEGE